MRSGWCALSSLLLLAWLAACQPRKEDAPVEPAKTVPVDAYAADVVRICDVMKLSGAAEAPDGQQMFTVADWLGRNVETEAGHDFLVAFQQTPDDGKAALLDAESARIGLGPCALAASWRR